MPATIRRLLWLLTPLILSAALVRAPAAAQPQAPPSSVNLVREGLGQFLTVYVEPLPPDQLLGEAWNGAVAAALAAGVNAIPRLGALPADRDGAWEAFAAAFALLEQVSEGVITSQQLAHSALDAMARGRNECHSYFLNPEAYARFREALEGRQRFGGIGVQVTQGPPYTVVTVFPGTPAERAGIHPGDEIVAVDDIPVRELNQTALSAAIRGPEGTPVTLTLVRGDQTFAITLVRALITVPILTHTLRPDGVGVINLNTFTPDGSSERLLRAALRDLEERGARAWVLDLRANAGGAISSVQSVLGAFLDGEVTAITLMPRSGRVLRLAVAGEAMPAQRPLAVLVGRASASGAEIAAAVLQDTGRARVFGQRTAACANAGVERRLSDGSALVITNARLLAGPQQRMIDGVGVIPDEETAAGPGDPTLQAAIAYLLTKTAAQAMGAPP